MAMQSMLANTIICGDCKERISQRIPPESIDLIYLDPPFFSGRNYEIIWNDGTEIRSFEDAKWYKKVCGNPDCGGDMPSGYLFCPKCGTSADQAKDSRMSDIELYIEWLRERLVECHRALKPTGSIYVHLDWHAVHYVKVMMDEIFGVKNFRNELIWCYSGGGTPKNDFPRKHDTILRYTKSDNFTFNTEYKPYKENTQQVGKHSTLAKGDINIDLKRGTPITDWWTDLKTITGWSPERTGYPTQKPTALLERIIKASSNPGDLILDPFCGCGTAVATAQKLGRRWIGIDVSPTSCRVMVDRIRKDGYSIGEGDILDIPVTVEELMNLPPFEFQNKVIHDIRGTSAKNKSGDGGIDGYTFDQTPIQVKQSKSGRPDVQSFVGAIISVSRERGIIIALGFSKEAHTEVENIKARSGIDIKLVTVEDLHNNGTQCAIFD